MPATITIRDEATTGEKLNELTLELLNERITVRELIRSRVYQEVKDYNVSRPGYFRGLVQPTDAETTLNGYKLSKTREIDWKRQFDRALEAFEHHTIIILVDYRQVTNLDEETTIGPGSQVTFLKLVRLAGG
jgi:hypothetical protein